MGRQFNHLGEEWEVELTETGHGVASSYPPPITKYGVIFNCISNPSKGTYYGHISSKNINNISEELIKDSLTYAIENST